MIEINVPKVSATANIFFLPRVTFSLYQDLFQNKNGTLDGREKPFYQTLFEMSLVLVFLPSYYAVVTSIQTHD